MSKIIKFLDSTFLDLGRQFKWTYLPPLMVYMAAGISGLTGIVGTFFVKDYLNLSAAFLAGLGFWAGIPWALKMPLGHLVDLIWERKNYMVYFGASLIALSLLIMYGLIIHTEDMSQVFSVETWFVISVILAPVGYVVQDVVADAMTVEAVPLVDETGNDYSKDQIKIMHTTMQTLGRFAIIGGTVLVALVNVILFRDVESLEQADKINLYGTIYIYALVIPLVSILGVILANYLRHKKIQTLKSKGLEFKDERGNEKTKINWWILGGSLVFVIFTLSIGSFKVPFAQEIVFIGSVIIILFLMFKLIKELPQELRLTIVGTAVIIFVFRAMPGPGPGLTWFEIDELGFNEQFFSILSLLASILTLVGIVLISMMAHTYLTQDTSNLLYLGYGVSLLISLFYLVRNKQIWFAIYSSSLPLIILIIFNFKGFHPENTGLDKLLLSGFLTLWLIYCYRLFNICKFYNKLKH